jgi:hypothetical protein
MKILLDLNEEQTAKLIKATEDGGLPEIAETVRLYVLDDNPKLDQRYRDAAPVEDGVLEIDGDALVSRGFEEEGARGAYVQCWVWVSDEDAGIEDDGPD